MGIVRFNSQGLFEEFNGLSIVFLPESSDPKVVEYCYI